MATTVGISVLFTDLVGSTALAADAGADAAERLRLAHFRLLREAVGAHDGREVKNLGDGIMAVFPGASAALDAAAAMQRAVRRHNLLEAEPRLSIRIGIATGDCTEEDGDYFGEPVVQAARLCGRAEGDEILATAVVALLVPRDSHRLVDVGPLELKGLPEPVGAVRLEWQEQEGGDGGVPLPNRLSIEHLAPLVGRREEQQALRDALKAATQGERRVVLITGEAGLGKTRLTAAFAAEAFAAGALILYGRCDEELAVPYLPWIESLGHYLEHVGEDDLPELDATTRAHLGGLLPGLRHRLRHHDETDAGPPSGDQYALVAAVTKLLEQVARRRPTVVVLDDLHWADDASLLLLRQIATALPESRLLLVGTYRDTDLRPGDTLTETSARLHRVAGVQRLPLHGLSDQEVVELVEGVAGHTLDERAVSLAHSLRTDTAGNPFFATEVLRHLAEAGEIVQGEDGRWTVTSELDDIALPQSVRDVVGQRVRRLGAQVHTVLTAAAVVGREFEGPVVALATDLGQDPVLDVLEQAMAAGLIAEVPGTADRFTFTHALVQHTLYAELSGSRRARMHHRVASAIEQIVGDEPGHRVGELAKHWFAAVQPAELDRAITYAVRAATRALESSAPDEAVRWFTQALEAIDPDQPELACEIQTRLGDAERRAGRENYRERLLDAARAAEGLGRDDLLVEAAISNYRGMHSASGEVDRERVAALEAALASDAGAQPANRSRLLATLVGELTYSQDTSRFQLAEEATALARSTGDDHVLIDALDRVSSALSVPELLEQRVQRTAEAMELTRSGAAPSARFFAVERRGTVLLELGDMAGARACSAELEAIATQVAEPTLVWLATQSRALLDLIEGDVPAAVAGGQKAMELALETGQPDAAVYYSGLMIQVQWHRGLFAESVPMIRQAAEDNPVLVVYRAVLALFAAHEGRHDEARGILTDLAAGGFAVPYDLLWTTANVIAAEAASVVGDAETAALLYERLSPYADQVAASRTTCQGAVAYHLGLLASTLGRRDEALAHHVLALEKHAGLRSPFLRARSMLALADLLQASDPDRATSLVAEAGELVESFDIGALRDHWQGLAG